jgi:putative oxidoreductase|tara:strand:+ start:3847 stop:4221 length:375 start_codon:yes stop_codon:yes gene_type:complete
MVEQLAGPALIVARLLMGSLFIVGGLRHFWALDPIAGVMQARGVPQARAVLIAGSVYQVVLGVTLALGLFVPYSALGLIVFLVVATIMLVNYWDKAEPERSALFGVFMSNIAIVGGLLGLAVTA